METAKMIHFRSGPIPREDSATWIGRIIKGSGRVNATEWRGHPPKTVQLIGFEMRGGAETVRFEWRIMPTPNAILRLLSITPVFESIDFATIIPRHAQEVKPDEVDDDWNFIGGKLLVAGTAATQTAAGFTPFTKGTI